MLPGKLAALNASLAKLEPRQFNRVPLGHDGADHCLKGGLRRGVVHEVFAAPGHETAATGFVTGLVTRAVADKRVMWIAQDFSMREFGALSATGLLEFGLDPSRLLLLHAADAVDGLRAAKDALSCAALGAVVIEIAGNPKILDLTASRRLALAAAQKNVTVFLLRFAAEVEASTTETRWYVRAAPSRHEESWGYPVFETDLICHRNGSTGRWIVEWNCDDGLFKNPPENYDVVVSVPADRPAAARENSGGVRTFAA